LRQTPNQGKGAALRTGFRWALAENYEAILTLDADGQHDPAEIPKFLDAYDTHHADLIIGARNFSQMPLVRRLANSLGRWSFSWALSQPVRDNQSGYRLISRRLAEAALTNSEQGFEFEVEMIVLCVRGGFSLEWVPIRTIYGGEASHINSWRHVTNFLRMVWRTKQSV
jgi:glycosyltransferase involved in cell wall biosynthesis